MRNQEIIIYTFIKVPWQERGELARLNCEHFDLTLTFQLCDDQSDKR